jgi:hypothetical protein
MTKNSDRIGYIFPNVSPSLIDTKALDKMPCQWYVAGQKTDNSTGLKLVGFVSPVELENYSATQTQMKVYKPSKTISATLGKRAKKVLSAARAIQSANRELLEDMQGTYNARQKAIKVAMKAKYAKRVKASQEKRKQRQDEQFAQAAVAALAKRLKR